MDNFYVNGLWFDTYQVARTYADDLLAESGKYHVVMTRLEMDSVVDSMVDSIINHEMECGK